MEPVLDYRNKVILAPMVRVGTLPMRLLALKYGADIVYGEEIVDKAVVQTTRIVNEALGTVDYIRKSNKTLLYRTCKEDFPNIFQIGTNNATNALKAAEFVSRDVVGIDINMGCPKHFSVHAGMGAALLNNPENIKEILSTLVRNLPNPITCKIRLKSTLSETIDLLKILEFTGIKAVGVHCRTTPERPCDSAHWDVLKEIMEINPINIPIIANGDVFEHDDIQKIRQITGVSSVMIARGAIINPSIFSPTPVPVYTAMKEYVKLACHTDNHYSNTKYTILQISKQHKFWANNGHGEGEIIHKAKSNSTIAALFDLETYYQEFQKDLAEKIQKNNTSGGIGETRGQGDGVEEGEDGIEEGCGGVEVEQPPRKKQKSDKNMPKIEK